MKIKKRVKKRQVRKKKMNFTWVYLAIVLVLFFSTLGVYIIGAPGANVIEKIGFIFPGSLYFAPLGATSGNSGEVNLTIYDDTDEGKLRFSNISVDFFANYTNKIGTTIDDTSGASCDIRYDFTGVYSSPDAMTYNPISFLWEVNNTFFYKGNHVFEVSCDSSLGSIVLENGFVISNRVPIISTDFGKNFIDFDNDEFNSDVWLCVEDTICVYDFSNNVTEFDVNDILTFGVEVGENTTLTNFTLDPDTGVLEINITNDINTGDRRIELSVQDTDSTDQAAVLNVSITPVNDPPRFLNLMNRSFNRSEIFEYVIFAEDEEDNVPFGFSIEFLSCNTAQWSTRGTTDCDLFDDTQYSLDFTEYGEGNVGGEINISFMPVRNDVGVYEINFSVWDSGSPSSILSQYVNFTVLNINEMPLFTYVCDNERNTTEDNVFNCHINVTDSDEESLLIFNSNYSWFLDETFIPTDISTEFKASLPISFIPRDEHVGNWSINVSVTDTGSPVLQNSTVFWFFVGNTNDSVSIDELGSVTAFTSNIFIKFVNATDDDLLIIDKSVYDESLTFFSNTSWVSVEVYEVISGTNITTARIRFDPVDAPGIGTFYVNISVQDANGFSIDSNILQIDLSGNSAPVWDPGMIVDYLLIEDAPFFLDLSSSVTDADLQPISFSFSNDTEFNSFSIGDLSGIIDFTPIDWDVGEHFIEINASDGITSVPLLFNFTVLNIDDVPVIDRMVGNGVTIDPNFNINTTEDSLVEIFLFVFDDDFNIPIIQQSKFYQEILSVTDLGISGPNTELFSFAVGNFFNPNRQQFIASFTPNKTDVGVYEISMNITDFSGEFVSLWFNLTVNETQHPPVLENLTNQATIVNGSIFYDINASDAEDGPDIDGNLTFSYDFLPDGKTNDFINNNESIFNTTSGVLNMTFNDTQKGAYHINVTVIDTIGLADVGDFWVFVSDLPEIVIPSTGFVFNLQEGTAENLTFMANSSAGLNLTYEFYINDIFRESLDFYGNGTEILWEVTPSFTDETYGNFSNLTLRVLISDFVSLNNSKTWDVNITHGNAPMFFVNGIGDKQATIGQTIDINLAEHFSDVDVLDAFYNQLTSVSIISNSNSSGISFSLSQAPEWILSLSSGTSLIETISLIISDLNATGDVLTNASSNSFVVEFIPPVVVSNPNPSSGGSTSRGRPSPFRIVFPDVVSAKQGETLVIPIQIVNDGSSTLNGIDLTSILAFEGILRSDLEASLSKEFITSLSAGASETIFLTVQIGIEELGVYEVTLSAVVRNPSFSDWGKIYISVLKGLSIEEKLVFTEELIVSNPECAELRELVEESREFIEIGELSLAEAKLIETVSACRESIGQRNLFSKKRFSEKLQDSIFLYLLIATIVALFLGIGYYVYRTIKLRRMLNEL